MSQTHHVYEDPTPPHLTTRVLQNRAAWGNDACASTLINKIQVKTEQLPTYIELSIWANGHKMAPKPTVIQKEWGRTLLNPRATINRCLMTSFFRILILCSLIVSDIEYDASIVVKSFFYTTRQAFILFFTSLMVPGRNENLSHQAQ